MQMKDIFTDAFIILLIFTVLSGCCFGFYRLLYPEPPVSGMLKITLLPLEYSFAERLSAGDTVYDTLTKRKVGIIKDISAEKVGERVTLTLLIIAERSPRGKALRTRSLWFEYESIHRLSHHPSAGQRDVGVTV